MMKKWEKIEMKREERKSTGDDDDPGTNSHIPNILHPELSFSPCHFISFKFHIHDDDDGFHNESTSYTLFVVVFSRRRRRKKVEIFQKSHPLQQSTKTKSHKKTAIKTRKFVRI